MSKSNGNGRKILEGVLTSTSFLSMQYRIPTIALDEYEIDPVKWFSASLARKMR